MHNDAKAIINIRLQPGVGAFTLMSRFNGLSAQDKPLKRLLSSWPVNTGLKPGVNENVLLVDEILSMNLGEPSPHPDPLPSHPMGAERGQEEDTNCCSMPSTMRQVHGPNAGEKIDRRLSMNLQGKKEMTSGLSLPRSPLTLTLSPGEREMREDVFDCASDSLTYSAHRISCKSAERFPLSPAVLAHRRGRSEERAGVRRSFN